MLTSIIRTVVPVLVGLIVSLALRFGIQLDDGAVTSLVTTVVTAGYYAGVRWLETHVAAKFGWLLGSPNAPTYVK